MKLEHVALWTQRLDILREYYVLHFQGVAGPMYHNPAKHFNSYFITFKSGLRLELMSAPSVPPHQKDSIGSQHAGWIHIAFEVDSRTKVDRKARELQQQGYRILDGPRITGDGYYEFTTLDPDGNRLEVCTKISNDRGHPDAGTLTLETLEPRLAVCRLPAEAAVPDWASGSPFWSVTRTGEETSVVCAEECVPPGVEAERHWRMLRVKGILDFSLSGILHDLLEPLRNEGIPVFVISTYRTDYLLIREPDFEKSCALLCQFCRIEENRPDPNDR